MKRKKQLMSLILVLSLVLTCVLPFAVNADDSTPTVGSEYHFSLISGDGYSLTEPNDTGIDKDTSYTFTYGNGLTKMLPEAEKEGYGFNGWVYESGVPTRDGITEINDDLIADNYSHFYWTDTTVLYPVFGRTVVWNFENGDTENPSQSQFVAGFAYIPHPDYLNNEYLYVNKKTVNDFGNEPIKKQWHAFSHWSDTPGGSTDVFDNADEKFKFGNDSSVTTATVNLYAVWNESTYGVEYKNVLGGVTNSNPTEYKKTVTANTPIELADLEKEGYSFDGWYATDDNDGITPTVKVENIDENAAYDPWKLYAVWSYKLKDAVVEGRVGEEITPLTLELADESITDAEFSLADGSVLPDGITLEDGVISGTPTEKGNSSVKLNVTATRADGITVQGPTVTFDIAKRRSSGGGGTPSYTVKFDTDGAEAIEPQRVKRNNTVTEPEAPVKDEYEFAGWFKDKAFENEYDFSSRVINEFTLYAKWVDTASDNGDDENDDTPPFDDVTENDWFYEDVKYVNDNGLMLGVSGGTFAPNAIITRAMFVTVIYRMEGSPEVEKVLPFDDVDLNAYYADAVIWGKQNKIVKGISEKEFAPNDNVTREQIATIMRRYAEFKGDDSAKSPELELTYKDTDKISDFAVSGVKYCTLKEIMSGKSGELFAPADSAIRAEIAAILRRFMEMNK